MVPLTVAAILRGIINWAILSILFGAIASWVWTIHGLLRGRPLLPETPLVERRKTPWGIGTILLVLVAYVLVSRNALERYALATRGEQPAAKAAAPVRGEKEAGEDPGPAKPDGDRGGDGAQAPDRPKPDEPAAAPPGRHDEGESLPWGLSLTELMFVQAAINSLLLVLLPGIARLTSGARLRDLGVCFRGWRLQAAVGIVAVLFLMPIVYAVQMACVKFLDVPDPEGRQHPVERMIRENFTPGVAYLAFLTAVVLAPLFEELLFRGMIQSWLVKSFDWLAGRLAEPSSPRRHGESKPLLDSQAGGAVAPDLIDPYHDVAPIDADARIDFWQADDGAPMIADPAIPTTRSLVSSEDPSGSGEGRKIGGPSRDFSYIPRSRTWTGAAIVLTSLFFAALHAPQWPAPIPLFLLSLGLGLVYQRTGSLIAPICMHAIFNGFSTLSLFYMALDPARDKPPARPVVERMAPAAKAGVDAPHVGPTPPRDKTGIHPGFF